MNNWKVWAVLILACLCWCIMVGGVFWVDEIR